MHILEIPPEIIAQTFEYGVHDVGISCLPTLCLTCKTWNMVVQDTPQLWGIFNLSGKSISWLVRRQIARAKSTQLWLNMKPSFQDMAMYQKFTSLAGNWVRAEVPVPLFAMAQCAELYSLEELVLYAPSTPRYYTEPASLLQSLRDARIPSQAFRSFTANGLSIQLTQALLCKSLTYLCLTNGDGTVHEILELLSGVPNLVVLRFSSFHCPDRLQHGDHTVHLRRLETLEIANFLNFGSILEHLCCPSLRYLSIKICHAVRRESTMSVGHPIVSFMTIWSSPPFLPENLHTLEIEDTLSTLDTHFLILWLLRLRSLVRLILRDDAIVTLGRSRSENIFVALAEPSELYGWLCPALMQLLLEADISTADVLDIARNRGAHRDAVPAGEGNLPSRLTLLQGPFCSSGTREELDELRGCGNVDEVICDCFGCQMGARPASAD